MTWLFRSLIWAKQFLKNKGNDISKYFCVPGCKVIIKERLFVISSQSASHLIRYANSLKAISLIEKIESVVMFFYKPSKPQGLKKWFQLNKLNLLEVFELPFLFTLPSSIWDTEKYPLWRFYLIKIIQTQKPYKRDANLRFCRKLHLRDLW